MFSERPAWSASHSMTLAQGVSRNESFNRTFSNRSATSAAPAASASWLAGELVPVLTLFRSQRFQQTRIERGGDGFAFRGRRLGHGRRPLRHQGFDLLSLLFGQRELHRRLGLGQGARPLPADPDTIEFLLLRFVEDLPRELFRLGDDGGQLRVLFRLRQIAHFQRGVDRFVRPFPQQVGGLLFLFLAQVQTLFDLGVVQERGVTEQIRIGSERDLQRDRRQQRRESRRRRELSDLQKPCHR
jgi:hypothetical protein